uniref:Uncharacterized protein n=1 Tax=Phocoena sinus TaxID=42100 RepID=A0A8C9DZP3_PHOSS
MASDFYLCYYVGHKGKFGYEFLEYANNSNYKNDVMIRREELEIVIGDEHISFTTSKIGSLIDVNQSNYPEGLRVFYYLVQDVKCLVFSHTGLHFKIKPI